MLRGTPPLLPPAAPLTARRGSEEGAARSGAVVARRQGDSFGQGQQLVRDGDIPAQRGLRSGVGATTGGGHGREETPLAAAIAWRATAASSSSAQQKLGGAPAAPPPLFGPREASWEV